MSKRGKAGVASGDRDVYLEPITSMLLQKTEALLKDAQDFHSGPKSKKKKRIVKKSAILDKFSGNDDSQDFGEALPTGVGDSFSAGDSLRYNAEDPESSARLPQLDKRGGTADGNLQGRNRLFNGSISSGEQSSFIDNVQLGNAERHLRSVKSAPSFLQETTAVRRPKPVAGGHPIEDRALSDFPGIPVMRYPNSEVVLGSKPGSRQQVKSREASRRGVVGDSEQRASRRVSEIAGEVQSSNTSSGWENQLARHILSIYASNTAAKENDVKSSQAIIRYVDTTTLDGIGMGQVKQQVYGGTAKSPMITSLNTPGQSRGGMGTGSLSHNDASNQPGDDDENEGRAASKSRDDNKSSRKKRESAKKSRESAVNRTAISTPAQHSRTSVLLNRGISAVVKEGASEIAKLRREISSTVDNSSEIEEDDSLEAAMKASLKYRQCIIVRGFDGEKVPLRCSPKVYPIWFVSTGDVYADWTVLPDGMRISAQLKVMSENKEYREYLGVLDAILHSLAADLFSGKSILLNYRTKSKKFKHHAVDTGNGDSRGHSRAHSSRAHTADDHGLPRSALASRQSHTPGGSTGSPTSRQASRQVASRLGSSQDPGTNQQVLLSSRLGSSQDVRLLSSQSLPGAALADHLPTSTISSEQQQQQDIEGSEPSSSLLRPQLHFSASGGHGFRTDSAHAPSSRLMSSQGARLVSRTNSFFTTNPNHTNSATDVIHTTPFPSMGSGEHFSSSSETAARRIGSSLGSRQGISRGRVTFVEAGEFGPGPVPDQHERPMTEQSASLRTSKAASGNSASTANPGDIRPRRLLNNLAPIDTTNLDGDGGTTGEGSIAENMKQFRPFSSSAVPGMPPLPTKSPKGVLKHSFSTSSVANGSVAAGAPAAATADYQDTVLGRPALSEVSSNTAQGQNLPRVPSSLLMRQQSATTAVTASRRTDGESQSQQQQQHQPHMILPTNGIGSPGGSPHRAVRRKGTPSGNSNPRILSGGGDLHTNHDNMNKEESSGGGNDSDSEWIGDEEVDLFDYQWTNDDHTDRLKGVEAKKLFSGLGDTSKPSPLNSSSSGFFRVDSESRAGSAAAPGSAVAGAGDFREEEEGFEEMVEDRLLTGNRLAILWIQLITTANAMAIVCVESKRFEDAMNILKQAEQWAQRDDILNALQRRNARAHIHDAFASYFFRRGRLQAAIHYTKLALELHEALGNFDCIAVDLLHISAIECQLGFFKESHKTIYQFLAMVENGRLAKSTASPRQLCMVSIGYHNLAVVQLKLLAPDFACKSSLNARKLARLCLSYSTRYLATLQWTHDVAVDDVKFHLQNPNSGDYLKMNKTQLKLILELAEGMYDPESK